MKKLNQVLNNSKQCCFKSKNKKFDENLQYNDVIFTVYFIELLRVNKFKISGEKLSLMMIFCKTRLKYTNTICFSISTPICKLNFNTLIAPYNTYKKHVFLRKIAL